MDFEIFTFTNNFFQEHTYVLKRGNDCVVIDPGMKFDFKKCNIDANLKAILLTHGHLDHIDGLSNIDKNLDVYINEIEKDFLEDEELALYKMLGVKKSFDHKDLKVKYYNDGDTITLGDIEVKCIHTPGHTKGSSCFLAGKDHLFVGDLVFEGSFGRTDLPTSNVSDFKKSLEKLTKMDKDIKLYAGHDGLTTIGKELDRILAEIKNPN